VRVARVHAGARSPADGAEADEHGDPLARLAHLVDLLVEGLPGGQELGEELPDGLAAHVVAARVGKCAALVPLRVLRESLHRGVDVAAVECLVGGGDHGRLGPLQIAGHPASNATRRALR